MSDEKTILLVDDTKENLDILMGLLNAFDVLVARDGETAIEIAHEEAIDLILLDIMMPGLDGFQTCEKLKQDSRTRDIPIIFITVKTDEDSIENAYAVGGVDYVTKPFKPRELLARVKTQLKLHSLIEHLEYLSSYDQMTGIYNRRKFFELGNAMFNESREDLVAVMIDIDHFKSVNDRYGHPVGDTVIKDVAAILSRDIGEKGVLGRIGGEEFAVLMRSEAAEEVYGHLEVMRQTVEKRLFNVDNGDTFSVTISGGMALRHHRHHNLDALLKDADDSLYEAKGSGRNRSIFRSI